MTKREFSVLKWSQVPKNVWLRVVFVEPWAAVEIYVPGKGKYEGYKAYFDSEYLKNPAEKTFTLVLPVRVMKWPILELPPRLRDTTLRRPFRFEFTKDNRSKLHIRNWEVL